MAVALPTVEKSGEPIEDAHRNNDTLGPSAGSFSSSIARDATVPDSSLTVATTTTYVPSGSPSASVSAGSLAGPPFIEMKEAEVLHKVTHTTKICHSITAAIDEVKERMDTKAYKTIMEAVQTAYNLGEEKVKKNLKKKFFQVSVIVPDTHMTIKRRCDHGTIHSDDEEDDADDSEDDDDCNFRQGKQVERLQVELRHFTFMSRLSNPAHPMLKSLRDSQLNTLDIPLPALKNFFVDIDADLFQRLDQKRHYVTHQGTGKRTRLDTEVVFARVTLSPARNRENNERVNLMDRLDNVMDMDMGAEDEEDDDDAGAAPEVSRA